MCQQYCAALRMGLSDMAMSVDVATDMHTGASCRLRDLADFPYVATSYVATSSYAASPTWLPLHEVIGCFHDCASSYAASPTWLSLRGHILMRDISHPRDVPKYSAGSPGSASFAVRLPPR